MGLAAAAAVGVALFLVGGNAGAAATAVVANSVAAIDPHSNRVVADIQVGGGASWIAAGAGSVWVLNERDQTISQIDPRERRLVGTFSVSARPAALGVVNGSLWIGDAGRGRAGSLLRLDAQGVVSSAYGSPTVTPRAWPVAPTRRSPVLCGLQRTWTTT